MINSIASKFPIKSHGFPGFQNQFMLPRSSRAFSFKYVVCNCNNRIYSLLFVSCQNCIVITFYWMSKLNRKSKSLTVCLPTTPACPYGDEVQPPMDAHKKQNGEQKSLIIFELLCFYFVALHLWGSVMLRGASPQISLCFIKILPGRTFHHLKWTFN